MRGLALVVVLLWGTLGVALAQQTEAAGLKTAAPPAGADTAGAPGAGQSALPGAPAPDQSTDPDQSYQAEADDLLKKLTARQFDARLPDLPLADWFARQIGKRAQIQWVTADCGDESDETDSSQGSGDAGGSSVAGNAAGSLNADVTLCSEAQALFYDAAGKPSLDRYVVLQLWVGSRRLGINDDPSDYGPDALSVFVFDGSSTRTLSRLGDLPGVLAAMD